MKRSTNSPCSLKPARWLARQDQACRARPCPRPSFPRSPCGRQRRNSSDLAGGFSRLQTSYSARWTRGSWADVRALLARYCHRPLAFICGITAIIVYHISSRRPASSTTEYFCDTRRLSFLLFCFCLHPAIGHLISIFFPRIGKHAASCAKHTAINKAALEQERDSATP